MTWLALIVGTFLDQLRWLSWAVVMAAGLILMVASFGLAVVVVL